MVDRGTEPSLVRYFCTAGNGMEPFLVDEVTRKLAAQDIKRLPGKVLFTSRARITTIRDVKSAERLFLLLKKSSPVKLSAITSPVSAASVVQSTLMSDLKQWTDAAMTWRRLQGELEAKTVELSRDCRVTNREEVRDCGEKCDKLRSDHREEEEEVSIEQNGEQTLETRREMLHSRKACRGDIPRMMKKKRKMDYEDESCADDNEKSSEVDMEDDFPAGKHGKGKTAIEAPLSFRISCKCSGSLSRILGMQEISKVMGMSVNRQLGWKADLRNPQLEISMYLTDDHCLLGIPLTRLPLANRSYIKTTGLRPTVAWAMAELAEIQPGFLVLDPMCGVGTILIEAAQEHKHAYFLGLDIDDGQLNKASDNVSFAQLGDRMHLLKASSTDIALPSASVDAVVCDLPFGRKFGTKANMAASLPLILKEMERVLRVGGTLVLLLSPQLSCVLKKLLTHKDPGGPSSSNQERDPHPGIEDCSVVHSKHQEAHSVTTSTQGTEPRTGLQTSVPAPLSSLKHQTTLRLSLGAIDGLLHKYTKIDT
ncbi:THUMP domain-containing protein 2 [Dunckerocampus dactyliophorus]|uniref:THUMP domain-containing protein 2 n=1 Tax=Dunckerocampus dactyliophorus TaxID=161453 RepID=UPI002406E501|nr:THUMP domain-containing protein 2 [Dunckerocampus dactyliophorus]